MDVQALIPNPDTIPAQWWIFEFLGIFTFIIHLLFMNVVVGGSFITLFSRLKGSTDNQSLEQHFPGTLVKKIPSALALAINFGVAPLLFIQVLYGHFIYSSSILMAVFWILVIPLLIIAYYGVYIHAGKYAASRGLSITALAVSCLIFIYIMMVYVNNMTLMLQPEKWSAYFDNRGGTILNISDPTFLPRFLHFFIASIAVAGLFAAIVWYIRNKKQTLPGAAEKIQTGLRIFGIATAIQAVVGIWFLVALPRRIMLGFMGGNIVFTILFLLGIATGVAVIITAFLGKVIPTTILLVITLAIMVINRANLRSLYLGKYFDPGTLTLKPQYSILLLFLVVFIIGLAAVGYMLKAGFKTNQGGAQ